MYYAIYAETNGVVTLIDESGEYNPAYGLKDPVCKQELNKSGNLEFTIYPAHPYFNEFIKMKTHVWAVQDGVCVFYGRVLYTQRDITGGKTVYCEGALSYLLDSLVDKESALSMQTALSTIDPSSEFWINVRDFTKFDLTVNDFFKLIIALHNLHVADTANNDLSKTFHIGVIDAVSTSERFTFDIDGMTTSADFVLDTLVDQIGGFIRVRPVFTNGAYNTAPERLLLDWRSILKLENNATTNTQTIEFGKNMISFQNDESGVELFTVLIPTGKKTDTSAADLHLSDIEDMTPEQRNFSFDTGDNEIVHAVIEGNQISVTEGVSQYGKIYKAIDIQNINAANTLYDKSVEYLKKNYDPKPEEMSVTALDLHKIGYYDQAELVIGLYTIIKSGPHGIERKMMCCQIDHKFREPQSNIYTFTTDLNDKGEGIPIFSKEDARSSRGSGGGSGGSSLGGTMSGMTVNDSVAINEKLYNISKKNDLLFFETSNGFRLLAESVGISTTPDPGTDASSQLMLMRNGIQGLVSDNTKKTAIVELLKDSFNITFGTEDESGTIKTEDITAQIAANDDMIKLLVNPHHGEEGDPDHVPASIKIGNVIDGINSYTEASISADRINLTAGTRGRIFALLNQDGSSTAGIEADNIILSGNTTLNGKVDVLNAMTIVDNVLTVSGLMSVNGLDAYGTTTCETLNCTSLDVDEGDITGVSSITAGSFLYPSQSAGSNVNLASCYSSVQKTTNGNDIKLTFTAPNGNSQEITFNRAATPTITGAWGDGTFTVRADGTVVTAATTKLYGVTLGTPTKGSISGMINVPATVLYSEGEGAEETGVNTGLRDSNPALNVSSLLTTATVAPGGTVTAGSGSYANYIGFTSVTASNQSATPLNITPGTTEQTFSAGPYNPIKVYKLSNISGPLSITSNDTYSYAVMYEDADGNDRATGLTASVAVAVPTSGGSASDVVLSGGSVSNVHAADGSVSGETSGRWYGDVSGTVTLGSTTATKQFSSVDVQSIINTGVHSGWTQCDGQIGITSSSTSLNPGDSVTVYATSKPTPDGTTRNVKSRTITARSVTSAMSMSIGAAGSDSRHAGTKGNFDLSSRVRGKYYLATITCGDTSVKYDIKL